MPKSNAEERARVEALADKIRVLFMFVLDLKADKDLLSKAAAQSRDASNFAMSAAPLLGAMGMDYEYEAHEASLRARRAKAVLHLIETLEKTEQERVDYARKQRSIAESRDEIRRVLGY